MKQKKSASILKKFLLFNLTVFSVLGLFTIIYLEAIQPNLVKERTVNHKVIISNTIDHFNRLKIDYSKEGIRLKKVESSKEFLTPVLMFLSFNIITETFGLLFVGFAI